MIQRTAKLVAVLTVAMTAAPTAYAQGTAARAGIAAAVRGDVVLVAAAPLQTVRAVGENVQSGDPVFLGDVIETGPNSGLQIMLMDETIFTIGPDAALVIDEFVYDPETSAGKVTASVLKGAFRFVSGRVAKEEPRNMNVKTPVGTIGIRGTSAAGRVIPADPADPGSEVSADIVLLGPGVDNNANERAGRIIVSNADTSVEISRSGYGTNIAGIDAPPTVPVRFEPSVVSGLTGDLGTNGGARPAARPAAGPDAQGGNAPSDGAQDGDGDARANGNSGQESGDSGTAAEPAGPNTGNANARGPNANGPNANGPSAGGTNQPPPAAGPVTARAPATSGTVPAGPVAGGPAGSVGAGINLGQATALSGQNIGASVVNAGVLDQIGTDQNEAQQLLLAAVEEGTGSFSNTVASFAQLQAIETGTATYDFGTVNLNYVSGPHTNSGGSYKSVANIDFGAKTIDLSITNVNYFFNGGAVQNFVFTDEAGGGATDGSFDSDSGPVSNTWDSNVDTVNFTTAPTDGADVKISAAILNNVDTGVVAAAARINVQIRENSGTTIIEGGKTIEKK